MKSPETAMHIAMMAVKGLKPETVKVAKYAAAAAKKHA